MLLACTPNTTFAGLMMDVVDALAPKHGVTATTHSAKLGYHGIALELARTRAETPKADIQTGCNLNATIAAISEVANARKNERTIVVIDEFDRITSDEEHVHFSDFIKQLGDQRVAIRFIFCGVSESLDALLGAHGSCYRYLDSIELSALTWDARFEIIDAAATALGVVVDDRPRFRIAAISDGFPHYIHRICEQLFWQMFNDSAPRSAPTIDHYRHAVAESVLGIEQHLKQTYEQAVMKEVPDYEEVLWAMADHADFIRNIESIYESYRSLFADRLSEQELLQRSTFVARLSALKGKSCECILSSPRKGWYQFRENIMRGYVRLRAEEKGLELALDYSATATSSSSLRWGQRVARRPRIGTRRADWDNERL